MTRVARGRHKQHRVPVSPLAERWAKPGPLILEHIDDKTCRNLGGKFDKKTGLCKISKKQRKSKGKKR